MTVINQQLDHVVTLKGDGWEATATIEPVSQRVLLTDYTCIKPHTIQAVCVELMALAHHHSCGKVLADVREDCWAELLAMGFVLEGIIPGYFGGRDAYCMSYFLAVDRQVSPDLERENEILGQVLQVSPIETLPAPADVQLRPATPDDAGELSSLFATVFDTYPTPLDDPHYVADMIRSEKGLFVMALEDSKLISAAAAECNWEYRNAEMTNCATLPSHRNRGLMVAILDQVEHVATKKGIRCLYSLARSTSYGMNQALRKLGYRFRGRRVNNCHIMGRYEDMNLWTKRPPSMA